MEKQKFRVFSMLADTVVFEGAESQCEEYKKKHENADNSLYVIRA